MEKKLSVRILKEFNAPVSKVWDALTNPALIKQYFFGTDAVSDWKEGSSLIFKGVWEGKPYEDKGTILKIIPEKFLKYNYWSSFSGKPEVPENYANIAYELTDKNGKTALTITQDNIESEELKKHSEQNWNMVLDNLKALLEKTAK